KVRPSVRNRAAMLSNTRLVCVATSPETISPDFGSSGIWPLQNRKRPLRIPCEYGPIADGASLVKMGFFMWPTVTGKQNPTITDSSALFRECHSERREESLIISTESLRPFIH